MSKAVVCYRQHSESKSSCAPQTHSPAKGLSANPICKSPKLSVYLSVFSLNHHFLCDTVTSEYVCLPMGF